MKNNELVWLVAILFVIVAGILCDGCNTASGDEIQVGRLFQWTATGDNGFIGTASGYDGRWAEYAEELETNWDSCAVWIDSLHIPKTAGECESLYVSLNVETGTAYYFAIKAYDENDNASIMSNVVALVWLDSIAPARITDLR